MDGPNPIFAPRPFEVAWHRIASPPLLLFDVRRAAAFAADNRMLAAAARGAPDQVGEWAGDPRFIVAYDGKQLFAARDATFSEAGKIALWTKSDSVTHFDSPTIRPLPEGGK